MTSVAGRRTPDARFARLMVGLYAITFFSAFEQLAIGPVMPTIADALDGMSMYALAYAAALATGVVGMVAAGIVADRGQLARAFATSGALFVVGLIVMSAAPSMAMFIAGRMIQGLGSGGLAVCGFAAVGVAFPVDRHRSALGLLASAWLLPSTFGTAVAVVIAEVFDWRWIFVSVAILTAPALLLIIPPLLRVSPTTTVATERVGSRALVLSLLVGGGVLVVSMASTLPTITVVPAVLIGVSVVVAGLWRMLPRGFFALRRGLPAAIGGRALAGASFYSLQAYLPLMLVERYDNGVILGGVVLTAAAIGWAVAAVVSSRMQHRVSALAAVRFGASGMALGAAFIVAAIALRWDPWVLAVIWGWVGLVMGTLSPATTSLVLGGRDEMGSNTAAMTTSESAFSASAIAIGGAFLGSDPSQPGFVAIAALGLLLAAGGAVGAARAG